MPLARVGELSGQLTPGSCRISAQLGMTLNKPGTPCQLSIFRRRLYMNEGNSVLFYVDLCLRKPSASSPATRPTEGITCSTVSSILGVLQG